MSEYGSSKPASNKETSQNSSDYVYLGHAREEEQLADMEAIAERDICFMCPEHIEEFYEDRGGLIDEAEHSYIVHNRYPYKNTEHHMMVLPKQHAESLAELDEEFILEAFGFLKQLEAELGLDAGVIAMRFGDPSKTGATVHHLHMHLVVPKSDIGPEDEPVKFRMSRKFKSEDSVSAIGRISLEDKD